MDFTHIALAAAFACIPGLLIAVFLYGKLNSQVINAVSDLAKLATSLNEHRDDSRLHTSDEAKVRNGEARQDTRKIIGDMDARNNLRFERLDTKMETIYSTFTAQLLTVLHHPDPAKIIPDSLLKKFETSLTKSGAITSEELSQLVHFMIAVANDTALHDDERSAAIRLLKIVRQHPLWTVGSSDAEA